MSIEDVVRRARAAIVESEELEYDIIEVTIDDLRALLDAYRDRKDQCEDNSDTIMMLGTERDALQEDNARIVESSGELVGELHRTQELLASARAQSEAHLQARLRAQSAQDGAEYELGEERRALNASLNRFRRLAARYIKLAWGNP